MKKFFLTALALSFLPGILPTSSHAQIPYNIVVCNEGTAPHSSASLIRTLSSTDNLLYYRDNTSAYNADALMEMTNKCYNSLDRYTDNERYLASGGDYVLAKKASYSPVSASCYRETRIPVINLLCPSAIPASDLFLTESLLFNTSNVSVTVSYSTYNTNCGE